MSKHNLTDEEIDKLLYVKEQWFKIIEFVQGKTELARLGEDITGAVIKRLADYIEIKKVIDKKDR